MTVSSPPIPLRATTEADKLSTLVLSRIASGDESAVDECLSQYGGLVWSLALRMMGDRGEAEDATQEIFVAIWQNAKRFDAHRGSEATFIAMIARRKLIDRRRRRQQFPLGFDESPPEIAQLGQADPIETADEAAKASECMQRLSDRQQKILTLSIHHGVSHSGISQRLDVPLGTVKSYARRALLQLRECMQRPTEAWSADAEGGSL